MVLTWLLRSFDDQYASQQTDRTILPMQSITIIRLFWTILGTELFERIIYV
jgi:hypothetical protein